ncbi:hypothetical protein F2Q69_00062167 [Brassica cretica]|uniref:Strictosidine synthase conserved region domain-containing protein n=1 Tax=Brassica cretica TaxID=69181 RepID=A0A8S9RS86_BRACR|nr:hypothetical protein F2Q69_00062167 [Brassica cretica]
MAEMYNNNMGPHPWMPMPQPNPFGNAFSGLIRSGLGSSSEYVQSNPRITPLGHCGICRLCFHWSLLGKIIWGYSYYVLIPWTCLCTGVLLVKTMKRVLFAEARSYDSSRKSLPLDFLALAQFPLLIWLVVNVVFMRTRSEKACARGVDSTTNKQWKHEKLCGRPLGLRFDKESGNLFIADAYYGLLMVGPKGGVATPLATHVEGKPILFANDLDIHSNGSIFFTDTSKRYDRANHFFILLEGESTGRLLRYDPPTKTTHVVLDGLAFPNGIQLSKDQSFLLFTETTNCRLVKYWLEGSKRGEVEVVADLPGFPDNVRMNEKGEFWVAIDCCRTPVQEVLTNNPWIKSIYFRLPIPMKLLATAMGMRMYTVISRFDEDSKVLEVLEDRQGKVMKLVSEVREVQGKLWIGTVAHNHIATLPYPLAVN